MDVICLLLYTVALVFFGMAAVRERSLIAAGLFFAFLVPWILVLDKLVN